MKQEFPDLMEKYKPMFRKRPVRVEAMQISHIERGVSLAQITRWLDGHKFHAYQITGGGSRPLGIAIMTLEGEMQARPGDWIIRGVAGEFYPCRNDIFEVTYEPISDKDE